MSPASITPALSLELRLRFLETLAYGPSASGPQTRQPESLTRHVDRSKAELKDALEQQRGTEAVRRFVLTYDLNEPLLRPALTDASSSTGANGEQLSYASKAALILEAQHEIFALERDLREIETLEKHRGAVEAGRLPEHEKLKPALAELKARFPAVAKEQQELMDLVLALSDSYTSYVRSLLPVVSICFGVLKSKAQINNLSEVYVAWNDIVTAAEDRVTLLEREQQRTLDVS